MPETLLSPLAELLGPLLATLRAARERQLGEAAGGSAGGRGGGGEEADAEQLQEVRPLP